MRRSRHHQRGAVFIILTVVLCAVGMGFVLLQGIEMARQRANAWQQLQLERVTAAADALRQYYIQNAACIDAAPVPALCQVPTDASILSVAGIPAEWNLVAHVSNLIASAGPIQYHELVVIAPLDDGSQIENFDVTHGTLTLCPDTSSKCVPRANVKIDGYTIEAELYARSLKQLNDLALSAQAYFNAKYLSNPDHDISKNWFRTPYCDPNSTLCTPGVTDMPVLDIFTPSNDSVGAAAFALLMAPDEDPTTAADCMVNGPCPSVTNAWGGPVFLSNGASVLGASYTSPPYRLAIQSNTPWNTPIEIFAVQSL
jgi:hypothetical protein